MSRLPLPQAFLDPLPVPVSIHSSASPEEALSALDRAVSANDYVRPDRNSPGFYRVTGEVFRRYVTLSARPYVMPGLVAGRGSMRLSFAGEVLPAEQGSELTGTITAPLDPLVPLALGGVNLLVAIVFLATDSSAGAIVFIIVLTVVLQTGWAWTRHHNQRAALSHANEVVRFLTYELPPAQDLGAGEPRGTPSKAG